MCDPKGKVASEVSGDRKKAPFSSISFRQYSSYLLRTSSALRSHTCIRTLNLAKPLLTNLTLNSRSAGPRCCPEIILYVPLRALFYSPKRRSHHFLSHQTLLLSSSPGNLLPISLRKHRGDGPSNPTTHPSPLVYLPEYSAFSPVTVSNDPYLGARSRFPIPTPTQLSQPFPLSSAVFLLLMETPSARKNGVVTPLAKFDLICPSSCPVFLLFFTATLLEQVVCTCSLLSLLNLLQLPPHHLPQTSHVRSPVTFTLINPGGDPQPSS